MDSVPKALLLDGQKMSMKVEASTESGLPIKVRPSGAERNYLAAEEKIREECTRAREVYVGRVASSVAVEDIRKVCETQGLLARSEVRLHPEAGGRTSYVVIEYRDSESAARAARELSGIDLEGEKLRVGIYLRDRSIVVGADGTRWLVGDPEAVRLSEEERAKVLAKLTGTVTGIRDDLLRQGGQTVTSASYAVTSQLTAGAAPATALAHRALQAPRPPRGERSCCLRLRNVFDGQEVLERASQSVDEAIAWAQAVEDDVAEECDRKGVVVHVHVTTREPPAQDLPDKDSTREPVHVPQGAVWVCMASEADGVAVAGAMAGRFFDRRRIDVEFVPAEEYLAKFPKAQRRMRRRQARHP